jgi:hypothetical protein
VDISGDEAGLRLRIGAAFSENFLSVSLNFEGYIYSKRLILMTEETLADS